MADKIDLDMRVLFAHPSFRRFLLFVWKSAGIGIPASGAEDALLFREGQRSLGLEIFRQAARGIPRGTTEQVIATVLGDAIPKETDEDAGSPDPERE